MTEVAVARPPGGARLRAHARAAPEAREASLAALTSAAPFLRAQVGRALGLRVTPELRFEYDTQPDTARRVDDLLRAARVKRDEEEE